MSEPSEDPTTEETASKARTVFCQLMRDYLKRFRGIRSNYGMEPLVQWDGGVRGSDGKKYKPVWPRIASFVLTYRLDLERLLRLVFRLRNGGPPPTPAQCYGERVLELYHQYADKTESQRYTACELRLRSDAETLRRQIILQSSYKTVMNWTDADVVRSVLSDQSLSVSPLLRYSVALQEGYHDIAERYAASALTQYRSDSELYDSVWGSAIPDTLRRAAEDSFLAGAGR